MAEENKNLLWPIVIAVLLVAIVIFGMMNANSGEQAAKTAVDLINKDLKPAEMPDLMFDKEVKEIHGIYEVKLYSETEEGDKQDEGVIYVTKDGKAFFPMAPIELVSEPEETPETAKSDKPDVKIFVMSYCPFGTQAERMYVPVKELLGDKANIGIYYVPYIMHGFEEAEQNVRQYCIDKNQPEAFSDYISCFVDSDDHTGCAAKAGVDTAKLATCYADAMTEFDIREDSTDFNIHKEIGDEYGVQGSPTFIINGEEISVERSAEGLKLAVCNAFNNPPAECDTELSSEATPAGIGNPEDSAAPASGSCN